MNAVSRKQTIITATQRMFFIIPPGEVSLSKPICDQREKAHDSTETFQQTQTPTSSFECKPCPTRLAYANLVGMGQARQPFYVSNDDPPGKQRIVVAALELFVRDG